MKSLYNKKGQRRGEGERSPFAFFAAGAIVVLAAVFVIGLQVGRVVEKGAAVPDGGGGNPAGGDIRKELGSYAEDAQKVPVVSPPSAASDVNEVEKKLTFRETLANRDATTVPLDVRPSQKGGEAAGKSATEGSGAGRYVVQAGAFRDKATAEARRKALERAGYAVRVVRTTKKNREGLFRVLVGPYPDGDAAKKAVRRIRGEMKIDAFLAQG